LTDEAGNGEIATEPAITEVQSPASAADEQNAEIPAPGADEQKPEEVAETPEQVEAKKESRRLRAERRRTAELATAQTEARIYKELALAKAAETAASNAPQAPKREDFDDYEKYIDARSDYRYELKRFEDKEAERKEARGKPQAAQKDAVPDDVKKAWEARESAVSKAHTDYREVVNDFVDNDFKRFSGLSADFVMESELGPQILYHLGTHEDIAESIAKLSPVRQAAELAKLEDQLTKAAAKKASNAPPPANHTRGGKTFSKDPSKMSQREYESWRKEQGARLV